MRTTFHCRYLHRMEPRRKIHEGLYVIESWNGANDLILYGRGGELATNRLEDQEATMLALHLLQNCMVYVNTLMLRRVLGDPDWNVFDIPNPLYDHGDSFDDGSNFDSGFDTAHEHLSPGL